MSLSATIIDALVLSGCTAEQLAAVMKADIIDREKISDLRRSKDAERQRRHRESRNVTVTACDIVTASLSLPPNEINSNPPTHTPVDIPRARKGIDFPKPEWADGQVWADLLANRKTKRLTNTATAHRNFLRDIEKWCAETGWPPGELLMACVAKGWGAIFDPREKSNGNGQRQANRKPVDGFTAALDRKLEQLNREENNRYRAGDTPGGSGTPLNFLADMR